METLMQQREKLRDLLNIAEDDAAQSIWRQIRKEADVTKRLELLAVADALGVAVRELRIAIDRAEAF